MRFGLDRLGVLPQVQSRLKAGPFGLLAHPASVNQKLQHIGRCLSELGLRPSIIFGPEHGYGGEAQDMIQVDHQQDAQSGVPIRSLYGEQLQDLVPQAQDLQPLKTLLIDLADVGSRYYTFVWTALLAVRAACRLGLQCVLLDRPNPIGGELARCEGRAQAPGFLSFVGLEPIPIRHGLTCGELVAEMASRDGITVGPEQQLDVVSVQDWNRSEHASEWPCPFVPPSPNMPTLETARVYPGGCLIEGTNLSEGRGTTRPFELVGAPWLDGQGLAEALQKLPLEGFVPRPVTFRPTFHKHAGQTCGGVHIHVTEPDRFRPVATYVALLTLAHHRHPEHFRFRTERYEYIDDIPAIDLLTGSAQTRLGMEKGLTAEQLIEQLCPVQPGYEEQFMRATERLTQAESRRR